MKNLLNSSDRDALQVRLEALHLASQKNWGKMSIHEVLPHLADPLRLAVGEKTATHQRGPFYNTFFGKFAALYMPWPKGAPTAPEFLPGKGCTEPTVFNADRMALYQAIQRFVEHGNKSEFEPSPVFGNLSRRAWGRLMWRHIDHHLRQFSA